MRSITLLLFLPAFFIDNNTISAQQIIKYKTSVFNAGEDGIDSYRIPSMVTTKSGTLLAFCEARKISSTDKTPTDIVMKRSVDDGRTWSEMQVLIRGEKEAFMDPVALVDYKTGKIFLFASRWPAEDHSMQGNTAWLVTSVDDGVSWSYPQNITKKILAKGHLLNGFGPGSGIEMQGSKFKNRLILPIRQYNKKRGTNRNRALYSDNHGKTWKIGKAASTGGEFEIAESSLDTLIYTLRSGKGQRKKAWSVDGGRSWGEAVVDGDIKTTFDYGGCQSSILSSNNVLFFTGPAGGERDDNHEDRQNLKIYRSLDGGKTWKDNLLLFDKAAGYSNISELKSGDIAIIFETADTNGFPKMTPGNRPPGWMRLDVLVLPKTILQAEDW